MSDFTKAVLKAVRKIPSGKVATYGQIARLAGKPHGARGVGWILNSMAELHELPWQRVINSKGQISFKAGSKEQAEQKRLLRNEGVRFLDRSSIDLKIYGWKRDSKSRVKHGSPSMFR